MIDIVKQPPPDGEPWDRSPAGGGWFNAANRALGREFSAAALDYLAHAGATITSYAHEVDGIKVAGAVSNDAGDVFIVLAHGTFDNGPRAGLRRTDTLKKVGFDVGLLKARDEARRIIIVTSHLPTGAAGRTMLDHIRRLADVVSMTGDLRGLHRLHALFGGPTDIPELEPQPVAAQLDLFQGDDDA